MDQILSMNDVVAIEQGGFGADRVAVLKQWVGSLGHAPNDAPDVKLHKTLLLTSSSLMASLAIIWGGLYYIFGQPVAAAIPWSYAIASGASIVVFAKLKRYRLFRFSQLLLSLLLPFFLMLALGGFVTSSAVVAWSLTSPLGALVFSGRKEAVNWFVAFLALTLLGIFIGDELAPGSTLPPAIVTVFFAMNICGTATVAFVLLSRFVFEREKAHEELEATFDQLKGAQKQLIHQEKMASLGQLTAGIAHEIKNPLNFITNFSQLSLELSAELRSELVDANAAYKNQESVDDLLDDLHQNILKIHDHGQRADGIVSSMMQHARVDQNKRVATNMNALVDDDIDMAYKAWVARGNQTQIRLVRHFDDNLGELRVVPHEITRVIISLLNNAFDAVQDHAESLDNTFIPMVSVETKGLRQSVLIRVVDNGPGISREKQHQIFEPFFTTKATGSGPGLGLSLAFEIVAQRYGGTLVVHSDKGMGATFTIELPRVVD